jgi:hypothetical protein
MPPVFGRRCPPDFPNLNLQQVEQDTGYGPGLSVVVSAFLALWQQFFRALRRNFATLQSRLNGPVMNVANTFSASFLLALAQITGWRIGIFSLSNNSS